MNLDNMSLQNQLKNLGFDYPIVPKSLASYIPSQISGNLIFTSGQLPLRSGQLITTGKLGSEHSIDSVKEATQLSCINALGAILYSLEDLNRITKIIRLGVFVASTPDFFNQHLVANHASDMLISLFGLEIGKHSRFAIGTASLPLNSPVELELTVEFL
jgi:enamine deaminase RidA (YjgF/YER057c/UK114 family)